VGGTRTQTTREPLAPGFIDNHGHDDAQVLWDPLCSFSCYHGATTVIFGNCSLGLAPVQPVDPECVAGMLSYVEAIPMDVLQSVRTPERWKQHLAVVAETCQAGNRALPLGSLNPKRALYSVICEACPPLREGWGEGNRALKRRSSV